MHVAFANKDRLVEAARHMLDSAFTWLRFVFYKACLDMCNVGMQDHLAVQWTNGGGPERHEAIKALNGVILLRENADLHWLLGSVDCTRDWPKADITDDMFCSVGAFHLASKAICLGRSDYWRHPGRDRLADLDGMNLPSQIESARNWKNFF